ncbi:sensor histidine kinase [Rivibacter subsaxonicus]|uniref:Histidine kinase n=1 Tax=Rivibacter subsaxonicus TaxID=457575 RepID=A0A4Q7VGA1_9BURK|nr:histidine kinase [Rivibacter subsaxonicus]RZT95017.1 histidine kinase [Rivibacter subsaxonicus]
MTIATITESAASWAARSRQRSLALARDLAPTLGFVVAVVALWVLFRRLRESSLDEAVAPLHELADMAWGDFWAQLMHVLLMLAIIEPVRRLGPDSGMRRVMVLVAAVALAAAAAAASRILYLVAFDDYSLDELWPYGFRGMFLRYGLLAALLVPAGEFYRAQVRSLEAMRAAEADRATLEQQTLQARLKTLEAQIEPHFLFNTLANVRRLYETDAAAGERMLDRLTHYLQIALPSMRDEHSTLAREAELLEAYFELQQVRMGRRLTYSVDIAPALRQFEVPPMMLLTLVENSIKHGLAPQREGGRVEVGARLEGGKLRLEVADTGRGFGDDTAGGGTGLANIRARLAAMFGSAAEFTLAAREPHGLLATIRLPALAGTTPP